MSNVIVDEQHLSDIAYAIRQKSGNYIMMRPGDMASAIYDIPTDGGGTDTSDGTATANDILLNKIAYSNGNRIVGNIATKTASDLSASGAMVIVPAGYYASQATKSVTTATAGTPTASKGTVSNHQVTITPTVTNPAGYINAGVKLGTDIIIKASDLVSGSQTVSENGTYDVTNLASMIVNVASGGGLPTGISKIAFGTDTVSSAFTTTKRTVTHNMGVTPDFVMYCATENVAQTYSMLYAFRGTFMAYRGSNYTSFMAYHNNNSTTTVTFTNTNSTSYGIASMSTSNFTVASASSSYYWRAGTYRWFAIKFA